MKKMLLCIGVVISILIGVSCSAVPTFVPEKNGQEINEEKSSDEQTLESAILSIFKPNYEEIAVKKFDDMYTLSETDNLNEFSKLFDESFPKEDIEQVFGYIVDYTKSQRLEKQLVKIRTSNQNCFIADILEYTALKSQNGDTNSSTENFYLFFKKYGEDWKISEDKEVMNLNEAWFTSYVPNLKDIPNEDKYINTNFCVLYKFVLPYEVDTYLTDLYYENGKVKADFIITNGKDNDIYDIYYEKFQVYDGQNNLVFDISGYELKDTVVVKSNGYYTFSLTIPDKYIQTENIDFSGSGYSFSINYNNRDR